MLPSYHRSSSSGAGMTELEPLQVTAAATTPSAPLMGNNTTAAASPPSLYHHARDLLFSVLFFLLGWHGPKFFRLLPSEEYLRERLVPYLVLPKSGDVVLDLSLNYPLVQPPTVSSSMLVITSLWVPIVLMVLVGFTLQKRSSTGALPRIVSGISSILLAVGGSEGTTQLLKLWVLRRRPNFYHLCEFNTTSLQCDAEYHELLEAQMSFPSGHSSLSWCGMVILMWFLLGQRGVGGKMWTLVCVVLPISYATFVACSRIVDYWHHVSDVLTGIFLGCLWGTLGHRVHHARLPPCLLPSSGMSLVAPPSIKLASFHE